MIVRGSEHDGTAAFHGSNDPVPELDDLDLFVGIVEAGSLSAAARTRGLPKSSVTRRLAALENRLQARLIERNTRHLAPTEAGRRLYERLRPAITDMRAAEAEFKSEVSKPHGHLRLTATGAFGRLFIAPLLGRYLRRHPSVSAELLLLDRPVSVIDEGFDLAIRMGPLQDSAMVHRKLADIRRVLCAAPAYLTAAKPLQRLQDLKRADGLVSVDGNLWSFAVAGRIVTITPRRQLATNQLEVLHSAVLGGCGIAMLPAFLVEDDLEAGRLVEILADHQPIAGAAHALWPSSRNMPARTRGFIDFLAAYFAAPEALRIPPRSAAI